MAQAMQNILNLSAGPRWEALYMGILTRLAPGISVAAALLAGCGGSQPPIGVPGATAQGAVIARAANRSGSWMLPEAKSEDLLYVVDIRRVLVYSYPQGHLVGTLNHLYAPAGDCVDAAGNVWILDEYKHEIAFEVAHGGTRPLRKLHVPGPRRSVGPQACSVDSTTGNLAVSSADKGVLVFPNATGSPKTYTARGGVSNCVYDQSGNLYVDGEVGTMFYPGNGLWELPKNGDKLLKLHDRRIKSIREFGYAAGIQWDGNRIALGNYTGTTIDRLAQHGRTVRSVQAVTLRDPGTTVYQFWIQGNVLIEPYSSSTGSTSGGVAFFNYPAGGSPFKTITGLNEPSSATVSRAPKI